MSSGPDRTAVLLSAAVHFLLFLLVWWTETVRPSPVEFVAYDIELVSPPSPVEGEPDAREELAVETPEESRPEPEPETETPAPPEPEDEEEAEPEEEPEPEPEETEPEEEEPQPQPETPPPEPAEEEAEPGVAEPDPEAETSGEDIDVRIEGLRRDYPAYYENIIRQINRCFRWRGAQDLTATVRFHIRRDGTVSDLSVVEPSGDFQFDFEAMGAVECAGSGGRLGALPEDLPFDRLPIEFTFRPAGG